MWNINTGVQAKGTSSAINYNTTRGQMLLIFLYQQTKPLQSKQGAVILAVSQ